MPPAFMQLPILSLNGLKLGNQKKHSGTAFSLKKNNSECYEKKSRGYKKTSITESTGRTP